AFTIEKALEKLGYNQINSTYFDTIQIKADSSKIKSIAEANEVNFYYPDSETVVMSFNETTTVEDLNTIVSIFSEAAGKPSFEVEAFEEGNKIPESVVRNTDFMTHEIFNTYQSETDMMRYIKKLERKDLSLNHSMISLGSCTMKLNAAAEMLPLSDPQWGNLHPFVPVN